MKDIATIPEAASADDARRRILEATDHLVESNNTAILPDGRIVPRGSPGAIARPPIRVVMFQPEFEDPILAGTKHHTIRPRAKRPWKARILLSLRVWTGVPYRTPQREFMMVPLLRVEPVEITRQSVSLGWPGSDRIGWSAGSDGLERFARADGFATWADLVAWFDNPFFPRLRSGQRLLQRPSPGKQFPSNHHFILGRCRRASYGMML